MFFVFFFLVSFSSTTFHNTHTIPLHHLRLPSPPFAPAARIHGLQACSISEGETCDVSATATIVYEEGDDTAGASSALGVDSLSNVESFQKIATSAGVDAEQVNGHI